MCQLVDFCASLWTLVPACGLGASLWTFVPACGLWCQLVDFLPACGLFRHRACQCTDLWALEPARGFTRASSWTCASLWTFRHWACQCTDLGACPSDLPVGFCQLVDFDIVPARGLLIGTSLWNYPCQLVDFLCCASSWTWERVVPASCGLERE